jgi:FtsH-binding integral membrane protein
MQAPPYPKGHPGPPQYGAQPAYVYGGGYQQPPPPNWSAPPPPAAPVVVISQGPGGYPGAGDAYAGSGLKYVADADKAVRRGFMCVIMWGPTRPFCPPARTRPRVAPNPKPPFNGPPLRKPHPPPPSLPRPCSTKVYGILGCQLAMTLAVVLAFSFDHGLRDAIVGTPGVLVAAIILSFVFLFALSCFPNVARNYPGNYLCLLGFTLCQSLMVGTIAATYSPEIVVKAVVATTVIVLGLTLFAFQTKIDFTAMSSSMFCILLLLLMFGIWTAIFPSQAARTAYAALGAVVFSLFICYDTQLIIGGKHQHQFEIDDYCFAALNLYIDIIQLFLFLLRLLGNRDGS